MINHCDRHITLLGDTDTVVRDSVINHCDRRINLLSDTDTVVVSHSMINHCDTDTVQSETYRDKSLIDLSHFFVILIQ
jgi:hypothetical protein